LVKGGFRGIGFLPAYRRKFANSQIRKFVFLSLKNS
jgi:hypothetical protein